MSYVGTVLGAFQIRTDQRLIVFILPGGGSKEQLTKERPRQVTLCLLSGKRGQKKWAHQTHSGQVWANLWHPSSRARGLFDLG